MNGVVIMPSGAVASVDGRSIQAINNSIDNSRFIVRGASRVNDIRESQFAIVGEQQILLSQWHSPDAAAGGCIDVGVNDTDNMVNSRDLADAAAGALLEMNDDAEPMVDVEPVRGPEFDDDASDTYVVVAAAAAAASASSGSEPLRPYPFYNYVDRSTEEDPDPLAPVTPPGRVPNFPAKMHAILAREDFSDIVCWMPHGRAWKIINPREFELKIVPLYFEHAKFSSFVRQANGWDFRRFTKGPDRNCYYNPYFLRGLPYLCKKLKRPGISKKLAADPDHEPDLYKISDVHRVPSEYTDDSVLLHCVLQDGPKARMPIYTGFLCPKSVKIQDFKRPQHQQDCKPAAVTVLPSAPKVVPTERKEYPSLSPEDQVAIELFQRSLDSSIKQDASSQSVSDVAVALKSALPSLFAVSAPPEKQPLPSHPTPSNLLANLSLQNTGNTSGLLSALAAANQLAFPPAALNASPITGAPTLHSHLSGYPQMMSSPFASLHSPFSSLQAPFPNPFTQVSMPTSSSPAMPNPLMAPGAPGTNHLSSMYQAAASSHFAAGFAAANAMNDRNFQQMMASFSASLPTTAQLAALHQQPQQPPR